MVFQKVCYDCGKDFDRDEFEKVWRPKAGRIYLCKKCRESILDEVGWGEIRDTLKKVEELGLEDVIKGRKVSWEDQTEK